MRDTVACFGIPFGSLESSGWPYLVGQYQTLVVILLGPVFVPLACQIGNHHTLDQSPLDPLKLKLTMVVVPAGTPGIEPLPGPPLRVTGQQLQFLQGPP